MQAAELLEALQEPNSEGLLRLVLDNVPWAVALAEAPSGRVIFRNTGVDRLFRQTVTRLDPAPAQIEWEAYHADGGRVQPHEFPLAQVMATGQPAELEVQFACGDGVRRWIRLSGLPLRSADGRLVAAVIVGVDVDSQRKTAELLASLLEEREGEVARLDAQLGAWFEHGSDNLFAMMRTDDERFVFGLVSPSFERATGRRGEDLRGKAPSDVFAAEAAAALERHLRGVASTGEPARFEEAPRFLVSRKVVWDTNLVPVRDPNSGKVTIVLGSARDVTEQRDMQARLAQTQRIEALGQLAGGIAHDFNNVLQAVQGGASLIERRPSDPSAVRRLARAVFEAAERGSAVTRRLLAFARRGDLRTEEVDAASLLTDMRELLTHTLGAGVGVRVDASPDLPRLLADKGQLETVLINLATNARDAMDGSGVLTLAARLDTLVREIFVSPGCPLKPGSYIRISVRDTGTGMPPDVLARVTEPFFTTKPQGQGTGLGLAMARGFAEQSGGVLGIESEPGQGTTVSLWLPLTTRGAPAYSQAEADDAATPAGTQARVLLVDDQDFVRQITAEALEASGFSVVTADSARAALDILDAGEDIHIVVSDLSMPGMDGIALLREVHQRFPALPAILLTGYATNAFEVAIGGALSGTFTLLRKPVTATALADRISVLLAGAAAKPDQGSGAIVREADAKRRLT